MCNSHSTYASITDTFKKTVESYNYKGVMLNIVEN